MSKRYQSGMFCVDIGCPRHEPLEGLQGEAYLNKKAEHCAECYAWRFFAWLRDKNYRIVLTMPEMASRELVARIKGIAPVRVEDLTEDEILCL